MTPDSEDFPRAIIPSRPAQTREKFDTLARRIADPMVTLFLSMKATTTAIAADGTVKEVPDQEMRFKAAAELMPYRYPKLKTTDVNHSGLPPGAGGAVNIQINIGSPTSEKVVSVASSVIPPVDPLD